MHWFPGPHLDGSQAELLLPVDPLLGEAQPATMARAAATVPLAPAIRRPHRRKIETNS
jgi:hypothetical protein